MRILIATPLFPPDIGGPATHAHTLYEELPKRGFELTVVSFGAVRHLPKVIRHLAYFVQLIKKGKRAELLYVLDPVSVGFPASIAAFLLRKKYVIRIAGDYAWEQATERLGMTDTLELFLKRQKEYDFHTKMLAWVERWTAKRAAKILVPSEYLKKILAMYWDVPEENIVVVHNGVESTFDTGNRRTLRAMLKVQGKVVMSAGRLIPLKNFEDIIVATGSLKKKIPELKLVIAGEGPRKGRLERLIARHKLEDTVVLTGRLDRDVLFRYISVSDVFVLNSWHETFSHLLLEVMAIGTPIVATDVGGTPEIIRDGIDGVLIPKKNKKQLEEVLGTLLASSSKARRLAQAAKERVKIFSVEKEVSAVAKVLCNIA